MDYEEEIKRLHQEIEILNVALDAEKVIRLQSIRILVEMLSHLAKPSAGGVETGETLQRQFHRALEAYVNQHLAEISDDHPDLASAIKKLLEM